MSQERIIIIMLAYVIMCIGVYLVVTKYWIKKKPAQKSESNFDSNESKSVLEELEMETNIFEMAAADKIDNEISSFEIASPYEEKTENDFLDFGENNNDDIIDDKIRKLLED